jgi:hypothetical protein
LDSRAAGAARPAERQWSITLGRAIPGGSGSYVATATCADGSAAVVKVAVVEEGWADQVATLERAEGRGYIRLLNADPSCLAILLEQLGGCRCSPLAAGSAPSGSVNGAFWNGSPPVFTS